MQGTIYVIKNLVNGILYVGLTIGNPKYRLSKHYSDAFKRDSQTAIHTAMRKYGKNNFEMRILETCDLEELNEKETFWINELDTYKQGYNRVLSSGTDKKKLDSIKQEFLEGKTLEVLAKEYHTCKKTISYWLRQNGIDTWQNNPFRALTQEKYKQAKEMYLRGVTLRQIEKEMHIDRKRVAQSLKEVGLKINKGRGAIYNHPYKQRG